MKDIKDALVFLWEKLLDLIFPKVCYICRKPKQEYICKRCYDKIKKLYCLYGINYNNKEKNYDIHIFICRYKGIIRKKILDFKFNEKPYLRDLFVKILLKNEKICRILKTYDIIIPVPIHKKRLKERGYNQSEILAERICENFNNLELISTELIKQKNTVQQSTLNKEQRIQNAKNVYKVKNNQKIINKRVILLDDIYTTGSTVNECSKVLKEAGAGKILVLTIAKD